MGALVLVTIGGLGLAARALARRWSAPADARALGRAACWATWLMVGLVPAHLFLAFGLMIDVMSTPDDLLFAASLLGSVVSGLLGLWLSGATVLRLRNRATDMRIVGAVTIGAHAALASALLAGAAVMDRMDVAAPFFVTPALVGAWVGWSLYAMPRPAL